jgi:hypothetical protein
LSYIQNGPLDTNKRKARTPSPSFYDSLIQNIIDEDTSQEGPEISGHDIKRCTGKLETLLESGSNVFLIVKLSHGNATMCLRRKAVCLPGSLL